MDVRTTEAAVDPVKYGLLLAQELPRAAKNDEEYQRMVDRLESLEFAERALRPEEEALRDVLTALVQVYEPECEFPPFPALRDGEVLYGSEGASAGRSGATGPEMFI